MKTFLQAPGYDVWKAVVDRYKAPTTPSTDKDGNKLFENNLKNTNSIMNHLVDSIYVKVMHCHSVNQIWDKLQNVYERDANFQGGKHQNYRGQCEQLKMKEYEYIVVYFL
jgi:hypothetical protein